MKNITKNHKLSLTFEMLYYNSLKKIKKKFLSFVTGYDRAPIDGLGSLPITISNGGTDLE